jgi:hypothetical protein
LTSYQSNQSEDDISAAIMNNFGSNQVSQRSSVAADGPKGKEATTSGYLECEQNNESEEDENMS